MSYGVTLDLQVRRVNQLLFGLSLPLDGRLHNNRFRFIVRFISFSCLANYFPIAGILALWSQQLLRSTAHTSYSNLQVKRVQLSCCSTPITVPVESEFLFDLLYSFSFIWLINTRIICNCQWNRICANVHLRELRKLCKMWREIILLIFIINANHKLMWISKNNNWCI